MELQITYADSTTQLLKYPVEIWYKGDRYTAVIPTEKPVIAATVNPDGQFPDLISGNNGWKATPGN